MKIVTVATDSNGYFEYLQKSCKKYNVDLTVLGWQQKWKGFIWRLRLMRDFVEKQNENELIIFIDAYDVILLRNPETLEKEFKKMPNSDSSIIVGKERHVQFLVEFTSELIFKRCNNTYINAGTYAGYAKNLKLFFKYVFKHVGEAKDDDQLLFSNYCVLPHNTIIIDEKSTLFLTVTNILGNFAISGLTCKNNEVYFNESQPYFAHGNGNTNMNSLIKCLGYSMSSSEVERLNSYNTITTLKKTIYYFKFIGKEFLFFIFVTIIAILTSVYTWPFEKHGKK